MPEIDRVSVENISHNGLGSEASSNLWKINLTIRKVIFVFRNEWLIISTLVFNSEIRIFLLISSLHKWATTSWFLLFIRFFIRWIHILLIFIFSWVWALIRFLFGFFFIFHKWALCGIYTINLWMREWWSFRILIPREYRFKLGNHRI